jgi:hypothetical protein
VRGPVAIPHKVEAAVEESSPTQIAEAPPATPSQLGAEVNLPLSAIGGAAAEVLDSSKVLTREGKLESDYASAEDSKWKLLGVTSQCMFHGTKVDFHGESGGVGLCVVARQLDGSWPLPSSARPVPLHWSH